MAIANKTKTQALLNKLNLLWETKQSVSALALLPEIKAKIDQLTASRMTVYARINFAQSLILIKKESSNLATKNSQSKTIPSWQEIAQIVATGVEQAKSLGDVRSHAYALGTLGGIYEETQQWQIAQDLTQQALLLSQSIQAADINYRWQWQSGRLFKEVGKEKEAIAAYSEAVNALKSLRSDLTTIDPEVQFAFRDSVEPIYRQLVSLLLQSQDSEISQQNLERARNVIESLQLAELENFFRQACLTASGVQIDQVDRTAAVIYPIILPDRLEVIISLPKQPLHHYSTITTAPSIIIPKSTAPSDNRFADIPIRWRQINANNSASGIIIEYNRHFTTTKPLALFCYYPTAFKTFIVMLIL